MELTFRTLVRGFLVVGGIAFIFFGATEGELLELALGIVAVIVGGIGLWIEWQGHSETDEQVSGEDGENV